MLWYFREMPLNRIEILLISSAGACSGATAEYSSYAEVTWFKHRLLKLFNNSNVTDGTHCRLPWFFFPSARQTLDIDRLTTNKKNHYSCPLVCVIDRLAGGDFIWWWRPIFRTANVPCFLREDSRQNTWQV